MSPRIISPALLLACVFSNSPGFAADPPAGLNEAESFSIVIDVDKHWNGPEAEKIQALSKGHPVVLSWEAMKLDETIGISTDQIERAAIVAVQGEMVMILRTGKPFDQRKVVEKLVPNATHTKMDDGHVWTSDNARQVVCLADHRTLVILPSTIPKSLADVSIGSWSTEKLSVVGDAATAKTLLVIQLSPVIVRGLAKPDDLGSEPFRPLAEARSLSMRMEIDRGLKVNLSAEFSDQKAAEQGVPALKKVMEGLNEYFELAKTKMPEFVRSQTGEYPGAEGVAEAWSQAIQAAQLGLQQAQVTRNDKQIETTIVVNSDRPVSAAVLLLSLVPRAAKKP